MACTESWSVYLTASIHWSHGHRHFKGLKEGYGFTWMELPYIHINIHAHIIYTFCIHIYIYTCICMHLYLHTHTHTFIFVLWLLWEEYDSEQSKSLILWGSETSVQEAEERISFTISYNMNHTKNERTKKNSVMVYSRDLGLILYQICYRECRRKQECWAGILWSGAVWWRRSETAVHKESLEIASHSDSESQWYKERANSSKGKHKLMLLHRGQSWDWASTMVQRDSVSTFTKTVISVGKA